MSLFEIFKSKKSKDEPILDTKPDIMIVNHAYNVASYILANNGPMKDGDTIDGVVDGRIDQSVQWKCHFEDALIKPDRHVLDICMNEYAAGDRRGR